jgi:hypothetical protein
MNKNLLFFNSGPMITYKRDAFGEYLIVDDLNPSNTIRFRLTPIQLFKLGLKCLWAAIGG